MNTQDIIGNFNILVEKIIKSVENEVYKNIDSILVIDKKIFKVEPLNKLILEDDINGFIMLANAMILFYFVYYIFSTLISLYNGNQIININKYIIKMVVIVIAVNSSYYICKQIIDIFYVVTDVIDTIGLDITGKELIFQNFREVINIVEDLDTTDILSMNGIIKSFISFGSISIFISLAIKYTSVIFLILISPIAIMCLSNNITSGIFFSWGKMLILLLSNQIIMKMIMLIPMACKDTKTIFYKIILVGSIYILYKIDTFQRELFSKICIPKKEEWNIKYTIYSNYKRNNKWKGIIEYKTLLILAIYFLLSINIIKYFNFSFLTSAYVLLVLFIPAFAIVFIDVQNENGISALHVILEFYLKNKIYVKLGLYSKCCSVYVNKNQKCIFMSNLLKNLKIKLKNEEIVDNIENISEVWYIINIVIIKIIYKFICRRILMEKQIIDNYNCESMQIVDLFLLLDSEFAKLFEGMLVNKIQIKVLKNDFEKIKEIVDRQYLRFKKNNYFLPEFYFGSLVYEYERKIKKYILDCDISLENYSSYFYANISIIRTIGCDNLLLEFFIKYGDREIKLW